MREVDIEEINQKCQDVLSREFAKPNKTDIERYKPIIDNMLQSSTVLTDRDLFVLKKKYKFNGKRSFLFQIYLELKKQKRVDSANEWILRKSLQIKPCKSWSGIVNITIFTAAYPEYTNEQGVRVKQPFSCFANCTFCPKEETETYSNPRSYLTLEPAVLRASRNNFDCAAQIWDRMNSLYMTGHDIDKIELIVSGGTWSSYPQQYRHEFCRDIYYAVNTYSDEEPRRERLSLLDEKLLNQTAVHRIVGLTIETRPDTVTAQELRYFREYGITRVQLGVQHIDDEVLDLNNRQCKTSRTIKGIKLLKENCYKIDAHWMLNLYGSTPERDDHMLNNVLFKTNSIKAVSKYGDRTWYEFFSLRNKETKEHWEYWDIVSPEFNCDTVKIYPTAVLPWTKLKELYEQGIYKPYDDKTMFDILVKTHQQMYPWVRVARVIRDIPEIYMYNQNTGADNTNMRQELNDYLLKNDIYCMDIRNREVKNKDWDGSYIIVIRHYRASEGDEFFISAESQDKKTLYGFVRLRLDHGQDKVFEELNGAALIREVHVYGNLTQVGDHGKHVQHRGIGRTLMARAEDLAKKQKYCRVAVIAAEGNKKYYEKLGYMDTGYFMTKTLQQ
jgi:histone acetyltransferase (RNA polymerase elongator complex component)